MKKIRYIRPTARSTEEMQRKATDHLGPFAIDIVEGQDGRTFETAIKVMKAGNALVISGLDTLGRRRDTVVSRINAVFDIRGGGGNILDKDGDLHEPECRKSLTKAIMSRGITVKGDEPSPRVAHNKTPDDVMAEAKRMWTQKQYARMTNKDIAEAVGISVVTLIKQLGPRGRKAGRPRSK
jgi:hypothetical protein